MALINLYPSVAGPKDLPKVLPCLQCLSELQLMMVLVWELNEISEAYTLPTQLATLFDDSACYTCLSDKQLLQAIVTILAYLAFGREDTVPGVVDDLACLNCANPAQIKAAIVHLIAKWTESQQLIG